MLKNRFFILIVFSLIFISSCGDETAPDLIPLSYVNVDINLSNIQYQELRSDGGFIYIPEGFKGIIVYRESINRYRAFERACTFDPHSTHEPVEVDSSRLFMIHRHCKSIYSFDGSPMGGPASLSLREYYTHLDGNYLLIRNE